MIIIFENWIVRLEGIAWPKTDETPRFPYIELVGYCYGTFELACTTKQILFRIYTQKTTPLYGESHFWRLSSAVIGIKYNSLAFPSNISIILWWCVKWLAIYSAHCPTDKNYHYPPTFIVLYIRDTKHRGLYKIYNIPVKTKNFFI